MIRSPPNTRARPSPSIKASTPTCDTKKTNSAPPLEEEPLLPPTCLQETALSRLLDTIIDLAANIRAAVKEGNSVTRPNKLKIIDASDRIMAAVDEIRTLPPTPATTTHTTPTTDATPLDDLKEDLKGLSEEIAKLRATPPQPSSQPSADLRSEIISAVKQELASFKRQINTAATTNQQQQGMHPLSYSQAVRTTARTAPSLPPPPPPQTTPPATKPALIIASKKEGASSADTLSSWRSTVSFKDTNFAPAGVHFVSNHKLRVDFDSEAHLQATLQKIGESNPYITAEVSKKLKPMFIVKGVNSEISPDELKSIIINQNDFIKSSIKDHNDLTFKFKRPNRNNKLYNAVFMTTPHIWRDIFKSEKLNVDHQRLHFEEFIPLLQCFKCLSYGHTRKFCTNSDTLCSHCSESGHEFKDCPVKKDLSKVTCYHCKTFAEKSKGSSDKIKHSATSDICPRKQSMVVRTRSRVDYGY